MSLNKKILTMTCSNCVKEHKTLAWFGMTGMTEAFFCRKCWSRLFNNLTKQEKGEWYFYAKNNASKTTRD